MSCCWLIYLQMPRAESSYGNHRKDSNLACQPTLTLRQKLTFSKASKTCMIIREITAVAQFQIFCFIEKKFQIFFVGVILELKSNSFHFCIGIDLDKIFNLIRKQLKKCNSCFLFRTAKMCETSNSNLKGIF